MPTLHTKLKKHKTVNLNMKLTVPFLVISLLDPGTSYGKL